MKRVRSKCEIESDTKSSIIIKTLRVFRLAITVGVEAWWLGVSESRRLITLLRCLANLRGLRTN